MLFIRANKSRVNVLIQFIPEKDSRDEGKKKALTEVRAPLNQQSTNNHLTALKAAR